MWISASFHVFSYLLILYLMQAAVVERYRNTCFFPQVNCWLHIITSNLMHVLFADLQPHLRWFHTFIRPHHVREQTCECYQRFLWRCIQIEAQDCVTAVSLSLSLTALDALFFPPPPRQLQLSIGLLSYAALWWPCRLYPASPEWMTADESPGLLLASPPLCNSTAGSMLLAIKPAATRALKTQAQTLAKLPLSSCNISSDILLTETIVTIPAVCYCLHCISSRRRRQTLEHSSPAIRLAAASNAATLIMRVHIKIS